MTAVASYRAEALKLRKRPAVWILVATMFGAVLLFGYGLLYLVASQAPEAIGGGVGGGALLDLLGPANVHALVLSMVSSFGGPIGLILGAMTFGSEYGWRTVTTMAVQRPQRLPLIAGRLAATLVTCTVLALAAFAAGAAGAAGVSLVEQGDATPPALLDLLTAYGVAALIIAVWCAIGACLATVLRGTGWAIGLGLLWALVVDGVLSAIPLGGALGDAVRRTLISNNVSALVFAVVPEQAGTLGGQIVDIGTTTATATLLAYLGVAVLVAIAVFVRRDIAR